ncbi:Undecaprenyl phosphate-alpha-4-amino-4-deoxy-L-arabinose arabinosyl transferase [bacterium HR30]|nr:Undecaprenyl phosphate-alpha-4-amino-4-deoxy-L-arabinose arabinosyl transferase [bacterium HR30]
MAWRSRVSSPWVAWVCLAVGATTAFFSTLNASPLIEPDEPRYAEIAREMIVRADWVTPTLNFVKYFEKPPLVYWLVATNLMLFGQHEWAVRLWSALFGLLGVACTGLIAARMFNPRTGLLSAAILATMPLYFGLSQVVSPDMPLAALCTACLTLAWLSFSRWPARSPVLASLFWSSLALGILAKGPVALVLVWGVIAAYSLFSRRWDVWRTLFWGPALLLFVVVAAPWFVLVGWRNPEFLPFFFVEQHVVRYLDPWEHRQNFWFYLPILLLGTFPWWLVGLMKAWRLGALGQAGAYRASAESIFLYAWFGVVFLFFSASGSKLGTYILPALPPLAILFARVMGVGAGGVDREMYQATAVASVAIGLAMFAAARLAPVLSSHHRAQLLPPALALGAFVCITGGGLLWMAARRFQRWPWLPLVTLLAFLWLLETVTFANRSIAEHYTPLAVAIREHWQPEDRIVLYRHYTQGIPYYTGQRVIVVGSWGELDFGRRQENHSDYFWPDDERLVGEWASGKRMFLVLNRSDFGRLAPSLRPPPRELARFRKKLVVTNFE